MGNINTSPVQKPSQMLLSEPDLSLSLSSRAIFRAWLSNYIPRLLRNYIKSKINTQIHSKLLKQKQLPTSFSPSTILPRGNRTHQYSALSYVERSQPLIRIQPSIEFPDLEGKLGKIREKKKKIWSKLIEVNIETKN